MKNEPLHYYEVILALNGTWEKASYTYASDGSLPVGAVVTAPFGKNTKLGVVIKNTIKPSFVVKKIQELPYILPSETIKLLHWLTVFYPFTLGDHLQYFLPKFLALTTKKENQEKPAKATTIEKLPKLTNSQKNALTEITDSEKVVLHGITGSGKTRVYLERIDQELRKGKNVLLLYPEISLTSQLESVLKKYYPENNIHIYHSKRTQTQQRATWLEAVRQTSGHIFIGPRSALFLPIRNIGLIVVDEAHDSAYKQDSGLRYNGLLVAASLAQIHKAQLLLGSATPPIQETQMILQKGGKLVCMHELAINNIETADLKTLTVDMKDRSKHSNTPLLSKPLLEEIQRVLKNNLQVLLFLNKRGTARLLQCEMCGWYAACDSCDFPMTYHHDQHILQCHVCGKKKPVPTVCPQDDTALSQLQLGVKAIEIELQKLFPHKKIARFDSDNKKSDSFHNQYHAIEKGEIDIIIGTQLITKGLDLPRLGLVGILHADSSLMLPDFTSEERTFQQLSQVSGRVGRGHTTGIVVLQTYQQKNPLINLVTSKDWHSFYAQELDKRHDSEFPPYAFLMKIWVSKKTEKAARNSILKLKAQLNSNQKFVLLGPAPSFYEKRNGLYFWQLIIKSKSRKELLRIVPQLPSDVLFDIDPVSLL